MEQKDKKPTTCSEAGRKGGIITSSRYGQEHYKRIGRMGGLKTQELIEAGKIQEKMQKAIADDDAGLTRSIRDYMAEHTINEND